MCAYNVPFLDPVNEAAALRRVEIETSGTQPGFFLSLDLVAGTDDERVTTGIVRSDQRDELRGNGMVVHERDQQHNPWSKVTAVERSPDRVRMTARVTVLT